MTIGESYKTFINSIIELNMFPNKNKETLKDILSSKIHGSDTMLMFPPFNDIKVSTIDDEHTELTIIFDDYEVKGIITWKPTTNGFVFLAIK